MLDARKANASQLIFHLLRRKEQLEWFAGRGHALGKRIEHPSAICAEQLGRERVVERDGASRWQARDGRKCGSKRIERQVRNHPQPAEEGGRLRVEPAFGQSIGERLVLEVERDEGKIGRRGQARIGKQRSLPLLRSRKIDFEDTQRWERVAQGECIETGAQNHILLHTCLRRGSKQVFGIAAARGHKGAKSTRKGMPLSLAIEAEVRAQQRHRNGIFEHRRAIEHLVHRPPHGDAERGFAGTACLHPVQCSALQDERAGAGVCRYIACMSWITWALLSAIFAAATALLAKVGVEHVDSNLATALRTSVVVVFAWGIAIGLGKHGDIRALDRRTCLFLGLSGLATGLSWLCYFRALQLGPASRVAPLDKLSVPLVMLFAWMLLGEKLNAAAIAGGLLITAGAVVMALA